MSVGKKRLAVGIAICADLIQIGLPFLFSEGFLSPFNDFLDVAVCLALTVLIGWHVAFIPCLLVELLPIANLAPTWTIAVFIAIHDRRPSPPQAEQEFPFIEVPCDQKGRPLGSVTNTDQRARERVHGQRSRM